MKRFSTVAHKEAIVACVRIMADGKATRECRTFDTTTAGLESFAELADGERVHSGGDGSDRDLLEAGVGIS